MSENIELKKGEYLFFQGEQGENLYLLISGELEVIVVEKKGVATKEDIEKDSEIIETISTPNSFIGEIGTLLGSTRTASIRAKTDCTLDIFEMKDGLFERVLSKSDKLGLSLIKTLTLRIQKTSKYIYDTRLQIENIHSIIDEFTEFFSNENKEAFNLKSDFDIGKLKDDIDRIKTKYNTKFLDTTNIKDNPDGKTTGKLDTVSYEKGEVIIAEGKYDIYYYVLGEGSVDLWIRGSFIYNCKKKYGVFGNYFNLFDPDNPSNDNHNYIVVTAAEPSKLKAIEKDGIEKYIEDNRIYAHLDKQAVEFLQALDKSFTNSKEEVKKTKEYIFKPENSLYSVLEELKDNEINQEKIENFLNKLVKLK